MSAIGEHEKTVFAFNRAAFLIKRAKDMLLAEGVQLADLGDVDKLHDDIQAKLIPYYDQINRSGGLAEQMRALKNKRSALTGADANKIIIREDQINQQVLQGEMDLIMPVMAKWEKDGNTEQDIPRKEN